MKWFKRVGLFLLVNVLVIVTISVFLNVVLPLFGVNLNPSSIGGLMVFCAAWGFGGAFISLFMSKMMAKWMMGVQIINPNSAQPREQELVQMVYRMAQAAGLKKMPEVGIYDSDEVNAFATGPSRNNSLVAVSTGLLNKMSKGEVEGVIGHEVAHVANGDMVTMTLVTGVVNSFVLFFSRIVARVIANSVDEKISTVVYFACTFLFDIVFTILGSIAIAYFSRLREYRADLGGAQYAGRDKMIAGLRRLQSLYPQMTPDNGGMATMKISNKPAGVMALFSTHPPLEQRIERLQNAVIIR
ncbi:MAG: protease HtpX [Bdellovibrionaceae bacterium]|nr:protease HtpX [Pseudobdellovibrionaceae bacterium]